MLYQRLLISSTDGHSVPVDAFVPSACAAVDPDIRRPAVVILPGGGYDHLSEREAEPVALRFLSLGFNAFVVHYRVKPAVFPAPQQDAAAVIAHIRKNADALLTNPGRIAVMGFSAGGHLAGSMGVFWTHEELWKPLGLSKKDVKPNALVLCYPVLEYIENRICGTFRNLTGSEEPVLHKKVSVTDKITPDFPPAFFWHTFTDSAVPVSNTLMTAKALADNGVPAEVHIYPEGPHGASLANEQCSGKVNPQFNLPELQAWPELAAKFLKTYMPE